MIGCFPDPYPDEIFYSICARYKERLMYLSEADICRMLFGSRYSVLYLDRPLRIKYLVSLLPPNSCYSIERIIKQNTLVPFYQTFFGKSYLEDYQIVIERDSPKFRNKARYIKNTPLPISLQFCPLCLKQDKEQFGEAYWHRIHQIAGIALCSIHHVFLQQSNVYIQSDYGAQGLKTVIEATHTKAIIKAVENGFICPPDPLSSAYEALLKVAKCANWLLNKEDLSTEPMHLQNCYRSLFQDKGYINDNETYNESLSKDFFEIFSGSKSIYQLLFYKYYGYKSIYSEKDEEMIKGKYFYEFLNDFLSNPNEHHPLCHLLIIHFLGYTANSFFQLLQRIS